MRKAISIFMLLLASSPFIMANDSTIVNSVVSSDTERMIDKYTGKVGDIVEGMAEALSVPVEHVYMVLVKQSLVDAVVYFIFGLIGFLMVVPLYRTSKRNINWNDATEETLINGEKVDVNILAETIIICVAAAIGVILFLVGVFHVNEIVSGVLNPEYKAIHDIAKLVGLK